MNNFEKNINNSSENNLNLKEVKLFDQTVPKIARAILDTGSLNFITQDKIDLILKKTEKKHKVTLNRDNLLFASLESIIEQYDRENNCELDETLKKDYESMLVKKLTEEVKNSEIENIHKIIRDRLLMLKDKAIQIDDKSVEQQVVDAITPQSNPQEREM